VRWEIRKLEPLIRWLIRLHHKIKSLKTRHPGEFPRESLSPSRPVPERKNKMASWTHEGENLTVKTRPWLGTNQTPETTLFTGKEMMAEASAERYRTKQQDTPEVAERSAEKWNALSENCWKTSNYKRTLCARDELPRAARAGGQTGSWLQNQCRDKAHHRRSNPGPELEVVTKKQQEKNLSLEWGN
jgi:hypothetical protein